MLLFLAVSLTTVVGLYTLLYITYKIRLKPFKTIPGSTPSLLFGNLFWVLNIFWRKLEHPAGVYIFQGVMGSNTLFYKDGIQLVWLINFPSIAVFNPDILELVLSSSTSLEKSYEYSYLHKWLGRGLLTSAGSKWKSRRKLLTPCFHFHILEDFLPTFNEQSLTLVKKLKSLQNEKYVDIAPLVTLCTLDIVCETVMGVRIGAQTGENPEYIQAVHNLGNFFIKRIGQPLMWSDLLFNLTSTGRGFSKDLRILHTFTEKVIKKKKESLTKCSPKAEAEEVSFGSKNRQALMDSLLDLHINGQQITEQDIREEVDTFMFEGHDTTAMGITYVLYCIGLHPEVQKKIHEELDFIFGGDTERPVTLDDARRMKYLECSIKETLRLYPSVPIIGRLLHEDIKYRGIDIPKGSTVNCHLFSLHRHPDFFPEPEVFDPDRFAPANSLKRHPFAYIPFSAGPRNCIGQRFALLEEKVVLCNILRHFRVISLDPRDKVLLKIEFILRPAYPIRMKFMPRK